MEWSAATVCAGILIAGIRIVRQLSGAGVARAVSAHVVLAFCNIAGAATLGVLIGFDKVHRFLPRAVLSNVFAHAHVAAIGWATMMVVGVAYRLLPMVLPPRCRKDADSGSRRCSSPCARRWPTMSWVSSGSSPRSSSAWKGGCCPCSRGTGRLRSAGAPGPCLRRTRCRGGADRRSSSCCGCSACRCSRSGLAFAVVPVVQIAAWSLLVASALNTINVIRIVRYAFIAPSGSSSTAS